MRKLVWVSFISLAVWSAYSGKLVRADGEEGMSFSPEASENSLESSPEFTNEVRDDRGGRDVRPSEGCNSANVNGELIDNSQRSLARAGSLIRCGSLSQALRLIRGVERQVQGQIETNLAGFGSRENI